MADGIGMPELPEVETIIRDLRRAHLAGCRIQRTVVRWPRIITGGTPTELIAQTKGAQIKRLFRRAKFLVFELDNGGHLLLHLRMSGHLDLYRSNHRRDPHDHLWFELSDGRELRYHDTRKFGRWQLIEDPAPFFAKLGPEPWDPAFTANTFFTRLQAKSRSLKPLLLDQSFIAGLGNIYTDEVLYSAKLHPLRRADTLNRIEARRLWQAIRRTLEHAIQRRGTSLGGGEGNYRSANRAQGNFRRFLKVYQRTGQPCARCKTPIVRLIVGQRGTHICPHCQRKPASG